MYLKPKSEITVGNVRFFGENAGVNSVTVDMSVESIGDTATVTVPRSFRRRDGRGILDYIRVGDRASIRLGYGDDMAEEFTGYVKRIGDGTPVVMEMDDDWYPYKKSTVSRSWKTTTLKEVLSFLVPGYKIELDGDANPAMPGGFVIRNATPFEAVKALRESYGFFIRIDAAAKTVTGFMAYAFKGFSRHAYVFGSVDAAALALMQKRALNANVAKNDLKFTRREDMKLQVTAKGKTAAGKDVSVTVGDTSPDADKRTLTFGVVANEAELRRKAETELNTRSFSGYTGKITGFGTPRTRPGDTLVLTDPNNPEREGSYLVKSVKIAFSTAGGFRRENELSYLITN
jgi:uncharacterized protein YneR